MENVYRSRLTSKPEQTVSQFVSSIEEDKRIFEEMKGHEEKCPTVVGKGASLAAGIIWDALHETEPIT